MRFVSFKSPGDCSANTKGIVEINLNLKQLLHNTIILYMTTVNGKEKYETM